MATRESITSLEQRMDRRFDHVDTRFTVIEERLNAIDRRITCMGVQPGEQFDALCQKIDATAEKIERRFEVLRREMRRNARWLMGLQVTTMLVALGAAFAR